MQENVETVYLDIDAKIAAESQHRVIVPIAAAMVAHTDVRPGAVIKIESWAGAEGFEKKPVHVHEEKIAVVVVKIPREKNVEAHGFGAAKMQVQAGRCASLKADTDAAALLSGQIVLKQQIENQEKEAEKGSAGKAAGLGRVFKMLHGNNDG